MRKKGVNLHHPFYYRRDWNKQSWSERVRDNELGHQHLLIPIHNDLHKEVEGITPPSFEVCRYINQCLQRAKDEEPLERMKILADELSYLNGGEKLSHHIDRQIPFFEVSQRAMRQRIIAIKQSRIIDRLGD